MNLIDSPWIPVRRRNGVQDWISPLQVSDPDVMALDAARADFNGALAQFLIGVLQTTTPMDSLSEWEDLLDEPPRPSTLEEWFAPVREAFELVGDGPRFMQDHSVLAENFTGQSIAALLIDQPRGRDHFVKHGSITDLCRRCAAAALVNLQFIAPEGGRGYYTSLRGGGPLSTLVVAAQPVALWSDLWPNVMERRIFRSLQGVANSADALEPFSWVNERADRGAEIFPVDSNPVVVYWAMPRRIWIDFSGESSGQCDVCHTRQDGLTGRFLERPNGSKYTGWKHPLTPYYEKPNEGWFPCRPKSGDNSYKHWLGWIVPGANQKQPATAVSQFLTHKHRIGAYRIWAFGYHMEKANPKGWCEATFPIYGLAECDARAQSLGPASK